MKTQKQSMLNVRSDIYNQLTAQEKNETVLYIVHDQIYHLVLLDLPIPTIPIENVFVSSGLNLPFSKGITDTELELGWYKGLLKNRIIPFLSLKQMEI